MSSCSTSGVSACGSSGPRLDPSHDFTLGESSPSRDGQGRPSASRGLTTAPRVEPVKEHPANVGTTSIEMTGRSAQVGSVDRAASGYTLREGVVRNLSSAISALAATRLDRRR